MAIRRMLLLSSKPCAAASSATFFTYISSFLLPQQLQRRSHPRALLQSKSQTSRRRMRVRWRHFFFTKGCRPSPRDGAGHPIQSR